MADVRVYIGNETADMFSNIGEQLAVSYGISDINSIDARGSSNTKTIDLPASAANKKIFGFAEDINSLSAFDNTTILRGRIEVGGTVIIDGVVKMVAPIIDHKNNVTAYKINILSGIADWKSLLGELNVNDLDFSEYDHAYTLANQNLSEIINGTTGTIQDRFLVYPLIEYGEFDGVVITGGVQEITTMDRKPALNIYTILHKMFNNQGYTLSSTFLETDYFKRLYMPFHNDKLQASDGSNTANEFRAKTTANAVYQTSFSSTNITYRNQLTADPINGFRWFTDRVGFTDDSSAGYFDNASAFTVATTTPQHPAGTNIEAYGGLGAGFSLYTCQVKSKQTFTAKVNGSVLFTYLASNWVQNFEGSTYEVPEVDQIEVIASIRVNSGAIEIATSTLLVTPVPSPEGTNFTTTFNIKLESPEIQLEVGDVVGVYFDYVIKNHAFDYLGQGNYELVLPPNTYSGLPIRISNVSSTLTIDSGSEFYNNVNSELEVGETLEINNNLPDIEQITLVQALKHLFNLYFYTDVDEKKIYIEPRDDFYASATLDWANKLDLNSPISFGILGESYRRELRLRYTEDSNDIGVKDVQVQEANDFILAAHKEGIDNKFAPEGVMDNTNPLFAPTVMDTSPTQLGWKVNKIPKMYKEYDEDELDAPKWNTGVVPRILYYKGVQNILGVDSLYYNVPLRNDFNVLGQTVDTSQTPAQDFDVTWARTDYAYMYSVDINTANDNSLYFNTTDKSYGLFENYYRNVLKTINEGRIIRCKMYLTAKDVATLDFRSPIKLEIDGESVYCLIQSVDNYNPTIDDSTDMVLLTTVGSVALTTLTDTADKENVRTISKRVKKNPLQTDYNGTVVDVQIFKDGQNENVYTK